MFESKNNIDKAALPRKCKNPLLANQLPMHNDVMNMKKGFVLTLDAMAAASVAMLMGFVIIGLASAKSPDMRLPYSIGGDLLSATDANGEMLKYAGYSAAQMQQSLQSTLQALPKNFCGNLTVAIFDANDFSKSSAYSQSSCAGGSESYKSRRIFADYNREKFGIAEIGVWMR